MIIITDKRLSMKAFEKKIKHHYVWAHYLRDWTSDGKNIHYITRKENIACDSIRGLGFEKNFYKIGTLKESDKEIIQLIIKNCNDTLKEVHWNFSEHIFDAQKFYSTISPLIIDAFSVDFNELMSSNLFENYLSEQESSAVDVLKHLRNGNIEYVKNKKIYYDLCYFLGYQFSRTKKMKTTLTHSLPYSENMSEVQKRLSDFYERNWWFMCSFIATNLSYDMSLNVEKKVIIIENNTSINFITSDQPVINLNPDGHMSEYIDYYYPLSCRRALLILTSKKNYFDYQNLSADDVDMINSKVAENSGETIFGKHYKDISKYINSFKARNYLQLTRGGNYIIKPHK